MNSNDGRWASSGGGSAAVCARPREDVAGRRWDSRAITSVLETAGIAISMDGRDRALDNVFIERLWRSVKYENIYLQP